MSTLRLIAAVAAIAAAGPAFAHTGIGTTHGFAAGFVHPVGGVDHALAMVAVGWLASRLGGWALPLVPAAFLGVMAFGGALALGGIGLPFVEIGIGLSVVAFGAALAWPRDLPAAGIALLVGGFAIFHGHAHGAEMPADASGLAYGAGFLLATALLHALGIAIGIATARVAAGRRFAPATAGAGCALAGIALLLG